MSEIRELSMEVVTNPFGNAPIVAVPQTGSQMAMVARDVAETQSLMVLAQQFPRNQKRAMDGILQECTRAGLADAASYEYSKGGQVIEGPSIRLAEVLARHWGNMDSGIVEVSRGSGISEAMAVAMDLETRTRHFIRFQVRHWIDTKNGGRATKDEREIYELIANMGARRKRACILAIIPGDVVDAALHQCEVTLRNKTDLSGEQGKAKLHKMVEAFAAVGVPLESLEKFIQRGISSITPVLFLRLGKIYNSIKDGMSAPADWFEIPQKVEDKKHPSTHGENKTETLKNQMRARVDGGNRSGQSAAAEKPQDQGEYTSQYDTASAIQAIKESGSGPDLEKAWASIALDYQATKRDLPPDIDFAYQAQKESFGRK